MTSNTNKRPAQNVRTVPTRHARTRPSPSIEKNSCRRTLKRNNGIIAKISRSLIIWAVSCILPIGWLALLEVPVPLGYSFSLSGCGVVWCGVCGLVVLGRRRAGLCFLGDESIWFVRKGVGFDEPALGKGEVWWWRGRLA